MSNFGIDDWVTSYLKAANECFATMGFEAVPGEGAVETSRMRTWNGGLISLVNDEECLQVAVLCDDESAVHVTKTMLFMEESEVDDEAVADVMCELINILGGALKTHAIGVGQTFQLGLPIWVSGELRISNACGGRLIPVTLDGRNTIKLAIFSPTPGRSRRVLGRSASQQPSSPPPA